MNNHYEDIIQFSHPISANHPHMPIGARAAQFLPFSALTGYGAMIEETARLTVQKAALSEEVQMVLDEKLHLLQKRIQEHPLVNITYFVPDEKKEGGRYVEAVGSVKRIDAYERQVIFMDGTKVSISEIFSLEGDLFD